MSDIKETLKTSDTRFKLTDEIARYIRLQRTSFRNTTTKALEERYYLSCKEDFDSIVEYFPSRVNSILDIGCGMAGIDILLYRHYQGQADIYLYDLESGEQNISYGYSEQPVAYHSHGAVENFLQINKVGIGKVGLILNFSSGLWYQVVISIAAMGFHFPISTYLDQFSCDMLICDLRKWQVQDTKALLTKFKSIEIIKEGKKYHRVVCR